MPEIEELRVDVAAPIEFVTAFLLDLENWKDLVPEQSAPFGKPIKLPTWSWEGVPWQPGSCIVMTSRAGFLKMTNRLTIMPASPGDLYRYHGKMLGAEGDTTCRVEALNESSARVVRTTDAKDGLALRLASRMQSVMDEQMRRNEARMKAVIEEAWRAASGTW